MSGPWDALKRIKQRGEAQSQDTTPFQDYTSHPQERKPFVLNGKVEETGTATYPQQGRVQEQPRIPLQAQYGRQETLQGRAEQTYIPSGLDQYREKDGYNVQLYLEKNPQHPVIAGFKKYFVDYQEVCVSEDEDLNGMATYMQRALERQGINLPRRTLRVLHQFDMAIPVGMPDGKRIYGSYQRLNTSDRQVDTISTEGELFTDRSIDGRPHRFFVGLAKFDKLDGTCSYTRAVIIPLERSYPNRPTEIESFRSWSSDINRPGDDQSMRMPQLESLPPHLQRVITGYPGMLFKR